jgi:hypothetical protein
MKSILFLFIALSFPLFVSAQAATDSLTTKKTGGLAIGPAKLRFTAGKGEVGKQVVQIVNKRDKPYQFALTATEWTLDSMGNSIHYPDSGHVKNSCASWITITPNIVTAEPGKVSNIVVTMNVPDDDEAVKQMHWCVINVTLLLEKEAPQKISENASIALSNQFNVILHVYENPPSATYKDIKMTGFSSERKVLPKDTTNEMSNVLSVSGINMGDVDLRCVYSVKLSSLSTGKTYSLAESDCLLLPGTKRTVDLKVPKDLPKGKYLAVASIDAGDDAPLEVSQKEVEIE